MSWNFVKQTGLPQGNWSSVATNNDSSKSYATGNGLGVYLGTRNQDKNAQFINSYTWVKSSAPVANNTSIVTDATGQFVLYIQDGTYLFASGNYGINWILVYTANNIISCSINSSENIFYFTLFDQDKYIIYKNTDLGLTWNISYTLPSNSNNPQAYLVSSKTSPYNYMVETNWNNVLTTTSNGLDWIYTELVNAGQYISTDNTGQYIMLSSITNGDLIYYFTATYLNYYNTINLSTTTEGTMGISALSSEANTIFYTMNAPFKGSNTFILQSSKFDIGQNDFNNFTKVSTLDAQWSALACNNSGTILIAGALSDYIYIGFL